MRGKRCKFSEEWRAAFTKKDREGEIVGESRDGSCWTVKWDGVITPSAYHKSYITVIERHAFLHGIEPVDGYVLIVRTEGERGWHIGWLELFGSKKYAEAFASENNWSGPWKAVRASLAITIPPPKRRQ